MVADSGSGEDGRGTIALETQARSPDSQHRRSS